MTLNIDKRLKLVFWIVLFESIGFFFGLLTQANITPWYAYLNKSLLTPPGFVFSIVWSLLYALLAVIAWRYQRIILSYLKKSLFFLRYRCS